MSPFSTDVRSLVDRRSVSTAHDQIKNALVEYCHILCPESGSVHMNFFYLRFYIFTFNHLNSTDRQLPFLSFLLFAF